MRAFIVAFLLAATAAGILVAIVLTARDAREEPVVSCLPCPACPAPTPPAGARLW